MCLNFIAAHLPTISQQASDLTALPSELFSKLAKVGQLKRAIQKAGCIHRSFGSIRRLHEGCAFHACNNRRSRLHYSYLPACTQATSYATLEELYALASGNVSQNHQHASSLLVSPRGASSAGAASKALSPQLAQRMTNLVNRVYKHKLEVLLKELRTTIVRCTHCGGMYSIAERAKLACPARQEQLLAAAQSQAGPGGVTK